MNTHFAKDVTKRFEDEIRFFKTWIDNKKALGALLPTSNVTARRMADVIETEDGEPIIELGPGTGVITKAILARGVLPENLYSIEVVDEFIPQLNRDFPDVNIVHGDAFKVAEMYPQFTGKVNTVVSGIPLLNFPLAVRLEYLNSLFKLLKPGRPVVQISHGPVSPIPPDKGPYSVEPLDWVFRNIPPARLWLYRAVRKS